MHIPKWLIYSAVGAFALFEVVTHAPDFLNAYSRYKAQRAENEAKFMPAPSHFMGGGSEPGKLKEKP
jgi:hypothetical protein